jgi:predicted nuclease with TOPRIM domain
MFSIFKKTDKYYFEEIQKKQKQVNKLNEDIKTMAKLALRDGKLQPSTEEQVSNVQQPQQQNKVIEVENEIETQNYKQQLRQPQMNDEIDNIRKQIKAQSDYIEPLQELDSANIPEEQLYQEQLNVVQVRLVFLHNEQCNIDIVAEELNVYLPLIQEAIEKSAVISIGNKIINGSYIMYVEY